VDYDRLMALPRINSLALSADGSRLVAGISQYDEKSGRLIGALWELDPDGATQARRLTRSDEGEGQPVFGPDGALYFLSSRANAGRTALWRLPAVGEAEKIATWPGGVDAVQLGAGTVVIQTSMMPGAVDAATDEKLRNERTSSGILHTSSPVSFASYELGPDEPRLQVVDGIDLAPEPGQALVTAEYAVTPDGRTVITTWSVNQGGWLQRQLVAIDTTTGERRVLADDPVAGFFQPTVSSTGRYVVAARWRDPEPDRAPSISLVLFDLTTGESRALVDDLDLWPSEATAPAFAADDSALFFVIHDHGEQPVLRVDLATGELTRVATGGCFTALQPAPDGTTLYAIRHHVDSPHNPVRIDLDTGAVVHLLPQTTVGGLERIRTVAADGTPLEGWLLTPKTDGPAPLLLRIHGGPLASFSSWVWGSSSWVFADAGYAVLLPDPAMSLGYGRAFVERGWDGWSATVYDDLMAITDAIEQRPDIDSARTAAYGESFGGEMVNWIAGHTGRFRCLISHAGIWDHASHQGTADLTGYFSRQIGTPEDRPERYAERSPRRYLGNITTPVLVTHGGLDQRVPAGQGIHLFNDLQRSGVESAYLSFPDEGHGISKPANTRLWNRTILDWLATYL
jgi:dipeptidyl aminopeptidase/acylaminoacyl peptidase